MLYRSRRRPGVTLLESAFVYPVFMLFLFGLIVGGLGVFRYQELAHLAREGARYASVHGARYAQDTGNAAATASDVYNNAILPNMVALDPSQLSYSVTWSPDNRQGSLVNVSLTYHWIPEVYFGGVYLNSSSSMPISY